MYNAQLYFKILIKCAYLTTVLAYTAERGFTHETQPITVCCLQLTALLCNNWISVVLLFNACGLSFQYSLLLSNGKQAKGTSVSELIRIIHRRPPE